MSFPLKNALFHIVNWRSNLSFNYKQLIRFLADISMAVFELWPFDHTFGSPLHAGRAPSPSCRCQSYGDGVASKTIDAIGLDFCTVFFSFPFLILSLQSSFFSFQSDFPVSHTIFFYRCHFLCILVRSPSRLHSSFSLFLFLTFPRIPNNR